MDNQKDILPLSNGVRIYMEEIYLPKNIVARFVIEMGRSHLSLDLNKLEFEYLKNYINNFYEGRFKNG